LPGNRIWRFCTPDSAVKRRDFSDAGERQICGRGVDPEIAPLESLRRGEIQAVKKRSEIDPRQWEGKF
jgi:hypothetical protein